jgi:hypothetical protein
MRIEHGEIQLKIVDLDRFRDVVVKAARLSEDDLVCLPREIRKVRLDQDPLRVL